jgi:LysM repeat protein
MDDLPPLNGDLSWVMQSDQVSDRLLIDMLVTAYVERLCRLGARSSGLPRDSRAVHRMLIDTLAHAVNDRHRYWGDSLQRWLSCRMLVQAKKLMAEKTPDTRQAAHFEGRLSRAEISTAVYDQLTLLKHARQQKFRLLEGSFGVVVLVFFLLLAASTRWSPISGVTPTPQPRRGAQNHLEGLPGYFTYTYSVREGDTLAKIAMLAGVSTEQIGAYNFLDRPYLIREGKVLRVPASDKLRASLTHYQVRPVDPLPPLTIDSSVSEVLDRVRHMELNWSTLRANMYWISYGPAGYAGPVSSVSQYMVFMRQPDQWVLVNSEYSFGYSSVQYRFNGILFSKLAADDTITGDFSNANPLGIYIPFTGILPEDTQVRVLSEGEVAGRKALVLEEILPDYTNHIWYDAQTGFPLRVQSFSAVNPDILLYEVVTSSIDYNANIPSSYFDPSRAIPGEANQLAEAFGYPGLSSQLPEWIHPRQVPQGEKSPANAALADLPVTVAFPGRWDSLLNIRLNYKSAHSLELNEIDIYAGSYLMGTLETTSNTLGSCLRSPDGQSLVMQTVVINREYSSTFIWFSLKDIGHAQLLSTDGYVGSYAYSPDSSMVAVYGCFEATGCGIHVLDLRAEDVRPQMIEEIDLAVQTLAWEPDSSHFAYIYYNINDDVEQCGLAVVELSTGQVTESNEPFHCSQGRNVFLDSGFIVGKDPGIEGCVLP